MQHPSNPHAKAPARGKLANAKTPGHGRAIFPLCIVTAAIVLAVSILLPAITDDTSVAAVAQEAQAAPENQAASPAAAPGGEQTQGTAASASASGGEEPQAVEEPWDYWPYRIQLWIASDDRRARADRLAPELHAYFDRDFSALWRLSIGDAPISVRSAAARDLASLTYDTITSTDPVIAVKRNHEDAARIRFSSDVGNFVKRCFSTPDRIAEVLARGKAVGNENLNGVAKTLQSIDGDALAVVELWDDPGTEAILTNRGQATKLKDPEAKIISLPIEHLVSETIESHDKLIIVHVETTRLPWTVSVVELDCLMRDFSTVHRRHIHSPADLVSVIGQAVKEVFAPMVRIDDAGQKTAVGAVRAAGLITDEASPAAVREGDFLVPMLRKNDRNGDPIGIGPLTWSFLHVKSVDGPKVQMDYHAGKTGGLQGRQNRRTFRTATRIRPLGDSTVIRLHVQRNPNAPLVGYEIYERALDSPEMTFVGRTNWDGRIEIEKTDSPMRLLYVKNGGAVLARLPVVPGQSELEVADLFGDDQRLRAEAYVRSVNNAILDLVAIRQLFAARIRMRLEQGKVQEAKDLLDALRGEPSYEKIAADMGRKLLQLKGRNAVEQMQIDRMFASTRETLVKSISPALIRELEEAVLTAGAQASSPPAPGPTPAETSQAN